MKWLRIASVMFLLISILPVTVQGQWEGWEIVVKTFSAPTGSDSVSGLAWCPPGKIVIAGGYHFNITASGSSVTTNSPAIRSGRSGWRAALAFSTPIALRENHFEVYAICVNAQQTDTKGGGTTPDVTPTAAGTFVLRCVLDDHTRVNASNYQVQITLNGTQIFSGNPGVSHGSPAGKQFTNFGDLSISFDETLLVDGQNTLGVTLSGVSAGNWFAWDYAVIEGITIASATIESATRWAPYSSNGVDGVYAGETREWTFNYRLRYKSSIKTPAPGGQ